jgi:hypothetical protein
MENRKQETANGKLGNSAGHLICRYSVSRFLFLVFHFPRPRLAGGPGNFILIMREDEFHQVPAWKTGGSRGGEKTIKE